MMIGVHISTALKQLTKNTGRSVLTMLGIIIGIGSVIFILTVGEVAKNFLISQISQFGTNVIEISSLGQVGPFSESESVKLTQDDVDRLEKSSLLPELTKITGTYSVQSSVEIEGARETVSLFGVDEYYFPLNHLDAVAGRLFQKNDVQSGARVALMGEQTANDLFGSIEKAVHKEVKIDGTVLKVIGVVEDIGFDAGFFGSMLYVPITTVYTEFAESSAVGELSFVMIEFENGTNVAAFKNRILYELQQLKDIDGDVNEAFFIADRDQFLGIFNSVLLGIQAFVSAVAAISLFVGGIGIMNIMLVTVKERTKEIGLRKAIGAKNSSIRTQFLVESVVLTTLGGVIGISWGLGMSLIAVVAANALKPEWDIRFVFVPSALAIACGVAFVVGIIFGLYPAIKAARLHPIEALRYE
jgi:putative ABC transport system permease protein